MEQVPIISKLQSSKGTSLARPLVAPMQGGCWGMEEVVGPGFIQDGGRRSSTGGDPPTLRMENLQGWTSPNYEDGESLRMEIPHNEGWRSANPEDEDLPPTPKEGDPHNPKMETPQL